METTTFPNYNMFQTSTRRRKSSMPCAFLMLISLVLFSLGCAKDQAEVTLDESNSTVQPNPTGEISTRAITTSFKQVNLVSDVSQFGASRLDTNLQNAWGIAFSPSQEIWMTSTHADKVVVYDLAGNQTKAPMHIDGDPIGIVYNPSSGFKMPGTNDVARYIVATGNGKIAAWSPWNPDQFTTVIDNSAGSAYTGITIAKNKGYWHIYAANVAAGTIDVYDRNWKLVTNMPFTDPTLPMGYAPFNIVEMGGQLYVSYVGPSGGYVNIFNTDGTFVKRFASGGTLNAPWAITKVPLSFGIGNAILVGNFGDGKINVYSHAGQYKGQLEYENGSPVEIDGLWALTFQHTAFHGTDEAKLYFAAGPELEEHGLFGYLEPAE